MLKLPNTPRHAALFWLVPALFVRVMVAVRTDVPGRDAASYLWMAEHAARGELEALFSTVFAPFYPGLVALLLWCAPGLDAVVAGQIVSCGMAALAVVPLVLVTARCFSLPAAHGAALVYTFGTWFARHPAECMSEGPFFLLVTLAVHGLAKGARPFVGGLLAGFAYATRPEGAALAVVGVAWWIVQRNGRAALLAALGSGLAGALVPLGYAWSGHGFTLTPKAAFNWDVGAGGAATGKVAFYFGNLLELGGAAFEGLGYVAVPLLVLGLVVARPRALRDPRWLVLVPFLAQCAVVPLLRANERFVLGYGITMLGFAGAGLALVWAELSWFRRGLLLLALLAPDLARLPVAWQRERVVERELGLHLRTQLAPGEGIATEMPRLEYFAGLLPGPPRPIRGREILELAARAPTRFVVLVVGRTEFSESALSALGFAPLTLPDALASAAKKRGIVAFERPRPR